MKILQKTTLALSILFMLGITQEGKATSSQPTASAPQEEYFILARDGHHRHHGGGYNHHWGNHHRHHHHWGGGGVYIGPTYAPAFRKVCGWGPGGYTCSRHYY